MQDGSKAPRQAMERLRAAQAGRPDCALEGGRDFVPFPVRGKAVAVLPYRGLLVLVGKSHYGLCELPVGPRDQQKGLRLFLLLRGRQFFSQVRGVRPESGDGRVRILGSGRELRPNVRVFNKSGHEVPDAALLQVLDSENPTILSA